MPDVRIPISNDRTFALASAEDACMLRMFRWTWDGRYVKCILSGIWKKGKRGRATVFYMHRLVTGTHGLSGHEYDVSHFNGNTRDNTRRNVAARGRLINNQLAILAREGLYEDAAEAERIRRWGLHGTLPDA